MYCKVKLKYIINYDMRNYNLANLHTIGSYIIYSSIPIYLSVLLLLRCPQINWERIITHQLLPKYIHLLFFEFKLLCMHACEISILMNPNSLHVCTGNISNSRHLLIYYTQI